MTSKTNSIEGEGSSPVPCSAFAWARYNDATVNMMLCGNACHTEIIAVLAREKADLIKRIVELELIAPRKITLPDGRVMVCHCPDHLLPNTATMASEGLPSVHGSGPNNDR
jgi:hypothetical protein